MAYRCMADGEGCTFADEMLLSNVLAGMASGGIASAVANPTDVLKVMVAILVLDCWSCSSRYMFVSPGTNAECLRQCLLQTEELC